MDYKQVILVRMDLKMGKGKTCAQVAHSSLGSAEYAMRYNPEWYDEWKSEGQKKVVVKVNSQKELVQYYQMAKDMRLPAFLVQDAGLTELPPGTMTTVGIGPAPSEKMDRITGDLKLL